MCSWHYSNILSSACVSARAIFNIGLYVGCNHLPPPLCRTLYMAMVGCHLINGSDVAPDISKDFVKTSSDVQKHFIWTFLHVNKNSVIAPLFTETGFMPIAPRRVLLALHLLSIYEYSSCIVTSYFLLSYPFCFIVWPLLHNHVDIVHPFLDTSNNFSR